MSKKRVFVGLSGGVDSSVTAALLKQAGYDVTGVYMKNWSKDLPGFTCPWKEDYLDAKRVAAKLGIPFKMYDFETTYKQKVVDYMIDGYKQGITPNPDIMCNQEIKFRLFMDTALKDGADLIATGHYARIKDCQLMMAKDKAKDQTYFLYRMSQESLSKTLMPIGDYLKPEVRAKAKKFGLPTADKPDSQGICFIGEVGIKEFLTYELGPQKPGNIIDEKGKVIGRHDGAIYYTIGQRHGLDVGGGLPYYVTGKNIKKNEVYVSTNLDILWSNTLNLTKFYWTTKSTKTSLKVRTRYRAALANCNLSVKGDKATAITTDQIRAVAPGQSAVFYDDQTCVGGGILI